MNRLIKQLDILPLVYKESSSVTEQSKSDTSQKTPSRPQTQSEKQALNKEELRLLVKILKAIGHSCEHQHIRIENGITHYQFNTITLIFDDVSKVNQNQSIHLTPLNTMLKDPSTKRATWEKLKTLHTD